MTTTLQSLILDFLEWLDAAPRPYNEVMAAWRTSCPRLTVWEDAVDAGYVGRVRTEGEQQMIHISERGRTFLAGNRR